jgi:RNA polymerase sigma factor (sigma-70 family)
MAFTCRVSENGRPVPFRRPAAPLGAEFAKQIRRGIARDECRVINDPGEPREADLIGHYLNDIGRYALLTKEDEVRLAQKTEAGREARAELASLRIGRSARERELRRKAAEGDAAFEAFVNGNLRLVVSIARKFRRGEVPLLDLVQEGNLGLMRAVEKFDWRRGFKFSTYATWWIRQSISRSMIEDSRTVRLPSDAHRLLMQIGMARAQLEIRLDHRATVTDLARELKVREERIIEVMRHTSPPLSLSEPLGHDGDIEVGDLVEDQRCVSPLDAAARAVLPLEVAKLLALLDDREREVVRLRFGLDRGEPRTLAEVGVIFDLTCERIRQIEAKAMSKLRHPSRADLR